MRRKLIFLSILFSLTAILAAQNETVEKLMRQFHYNEAIDQLKGQPATTDNLLLMAECHEKLNNYHSAITAYEPKIPFNCNHTLNRPLYLTEK